MCQGRVTPEAKAGLPPFKRLVIACCRAKQTHSEGRCKRVLSWHTAQRDASRGDPSSTIPECNCSHKEARRGPRPLKASKPSSVQSRAPRLPPHLYPPPNSVPPQTTLPVSVVTSYSVRQLTFRREQCREDDVERRARLSGSRPGSDRCRCFYNHTGLSASCWGLNGFTLGRQSPERSRLCPS